MMSFENFTEYVKSSVLQYLPPEYADTEVSIAKVAKNNNQRLTGIVIKNPESNICPTVYLEGVFSKYEIGDLELDECVKEVAEIYLHNLVSDKTFDVSNFISYENAKDKVIPRLVSSEDNEAYLEGIPHRVMDGLAVVYYLPVAEFNGKGNSASIRIHNGIMQSWGVTEEELYAVATDNLSKSEAKFQTMGEVLREIMFSHGDEEWPVDILPAEDVGMYVLSNSEKLFGASMLLNHNVMDDITERIGEFYILPSSVHETILLRKDTAQSLEYLERMVQEVNLTQVEAEERLSDHVFLYDIKTKEIYRADHEAEHRKNVAETEEAAKTNEQMQTTVRRRGR